MKKKSDKIDHLTGWEWTTLVAAWRYYEHGHTIASAMFPSDMLRRFWGEDNPYSDEVRDTIAVLLRTIDVLEGRQKLGKPETKGETK